jgi:hypothetical protein
VFRGSKCIRRRAFRSRCLSLQTFMNVRWSIGGLLSKEAERALELTRAPRFFYRPVVMNSCGKLLRPPEVNFG